MQKVSRPTWAEVDLSAIAHNYKWLKKRLSAETRLLAVVKANAYGHGMIEVSKRLIECGVDFFAVASVDEAAELRQKGIKKPVLILGGILPDEIDGVLKYDCLQAVADTELAGELNRRAARRKKKARIHAKVDTGMGRFGAWHEDAVDFIKALKGKKSLLLDGLFTHFSSADEGEENASYTRRQINFFISLIEKLKRMNIKIPFKHAANSMASVLFRDSHLNLIRPGLMLYGLCPRFELTKKINLKPVLGLKTRVVFLKDVPAGRHISYDRTYTTKQNTKIATIPVGYADGYPRALSNKAEVLVGGKRAPVIGNVCMDHTMIDVGHLPDIITGEEVVLIGTQANQQISVEELALRANTIPYEIVTSISTRVPRIYRKNRDSPISRR